MSAVAPIRHGGNLLAAARRYGRLVAEWLDLSTGINPNGYPVPPLPAEVWQRLPQDDDALADIAARAYGGAQALPVAGSQAAIRTLPRLLRPGRVGIAALGYSEYAPAFALAGHTVVPLDEADFARADLADDLDHLVVVNPNNPTARLLAAPTPRHWHRQVARRHGTLVVDEAFMDALAVLSLVADAARAGPRRAALARQVLRVGGRALRLRCPRRRTCSRHSATSSATGPSPVRRAPSPSTPSPIPTGSTPRAPDSPPPASGWPCCCASTGCPRCRNRCSAGCPMPARRPCTGRWRSKACGPGCSMRPAAAPPACAWACRPMTNLAGAGSTARRPTPSPLSHPDTTKSSPR